MINIPSCVKVDNSNIVEKCVNKIVSEITNATSRGDKKYSVQVTTENCYTGGYPMDVINKVAKMFADKGYFVYLIRGGAYTNWTWLSVSNYAFPEGCVRSQFNKRVY